MVSDVDPAVADANRRVAEEMASAIARAEVVVIPGAGHAVHLESPAAVAQVIRA